MRAPADPRHRSWLSPRPFPRWSTPLWWVVSALVVVVVLSTSCDGEAPPAGGCADACQASVPACATCPAVAEEICVEETCVARGDDITDVIADVNLDRDLTGVTELVLAVVDARSHSCDDLVDLVNQADVLAGTSVNVSGGSFHPDLVFGRVPEGDVLLAVDALDNGDAVVARGCVAVAASGSVLDAGVIDVRSR